ncbi:MAG: hypothetical protein ACRDIB_01355, partial [Ardenticatenaceae bacterium]
MRSDATSSDSALRRYIAQVKPRAVEWNLAPVARATFALFLCLALATPGWRSGPFAWWPILALPGDEGEGLIGILALLPVAILLLWGLARLLRRERHPWHWGDHRVAFPLLALSVIVLAGLEPIVDRRTLVQVTGIALMWLVYLFVLNEKPALYVPLAGVILLQGGIAVAQFLLQHDVGLGWLGELSLDPFAMDRSVLVARGRPWLRAYGLTAHPNALGALLATLLLLVLPAAAAAKGWRRSWLAAGISVAFLGLLVTFSRAAWLALAAGLLVW